MKDLTEFEYSASIAWDDEIIGSFSAVAVGWITNVVPQKGKLSVDVLEAVRHFHKYHWVDEGWMGYHTCEICKEYMDRGEFLIILEKTHYILPKMILHYIEAHEYVPPHTFTQKLSSWWNSSGATQCREKRCEAVSNST